VQWSTALIEHGKPPETPVAIVRYCSWTQQQVVRCTLRTVAETVREQGLRPPAVFVVGKAVDHAPRRSWFAGRPLFGRRVLVAGSPNTSENLRDQRVGESPGWQALADELRGGGAHVDIVLCDGVSAVSPDSDVARALGSDEIDWITVTSPAAARSLARLYGDALRRTRLASIGPPTSKALRDLGYEPAAEASPQTTAGLVDAILRVAQDSCGDYMTA
jgi:uroporphyrinogen III methyltransferase/synthase